MPTTGQGLKDTQNTLYDVDFPMGECSYFSVTGTAITIAAQSDGSTNMVLVNPATSFNNDSYLFTNSNGRLTYTGIATKMFHAALTMSMSPDAANETFVIGLAKNGVVQSGKVLCKLTTATDVKAFSFHVMISLATNDYIEIYVGNLTSTADVVIYSLNLFAMGT